MRVLVLMCGVMGSGKSTFVKEHGLENYTICPDTIRTMVTGTHLEVDGKEGIMYIQGMEKKTWDIVKDMVRNRLEVGSFTVLDATNLSLNNAQPFLQIAKDTHSRVFVVDMMKENSFAECLARNEKRKFNKIPDSALEMAWNNYQKLKWNSKVEVIAPSEFEEKVYRKSAQVDGMFDNVAVFGDIHGCFDVFMDAMNDLPENTLKVFIGDYCDRGNKSVEMITWCMEHKDDADKIFIEGNHEAHLRAYSKNVKATPKFEETTRVEFDKAGISRKELRRFLGKLREMFYFQIGGHTVIASHGGISGIGRNLVFVPKREFVHGTGGYHEMSEVAESWDKQGGVIQVHGHRNIEEKEVKESQFCYNLEGKIEFGGDLRVVVFGSDGSIQTKKYHNTYMKNVGYDKDSVADFVQACRKSSFIREKEFGDISSFNFTHNAFYNAVWDNLTQKARGLYINTNTHEVVARGFDKFFNIGERPHTEISDLADTMAYPVTVYKKENGFLGLIGYDKESDTLIMTSKSQLDGKFAKLVWDNVRNKVGDDGIERIKDFVKENRCTLAVEVCDKDNDPHIIEYDNSDVYLLAVIQNDIVYKDLEYDELVRIAENLGLNYKKKFTVLNNRSEFLDFFEHDYGEIEGFVLEDMDKYMVKYKTPYYLYWKHKRSLLQNPNAKRFAEDDDAFVTWLIENDVDKKTPIIEVRKMYEKRLSNE